MAPSAKNPNATSRAKLAAKATKKRTQQQRQSADGHKSRIAKQDKRRGARDGLLPTSGPNKAISRKKARKMERALGHALRRQEEAEAAEADDDETADREMLEEDEDEDDTTNDVAAVSSANTATTSKKGKTKTKNKSKGTAEATREVEMDDIA